jgi:DNA-binding SARP family transcriptional activator
MRRLVRVADPAARRWYRSQLDLLMGTALGRLPSAEARLRRFIRTPESGDLDSGIQAFSRLGQLLIKRSRWEEARPVLEAGLARVAEVSAPGDARLVAARCEMLCDLARVATLGDDLNAAQTLLQQADDALTGPDGEPPGGEPPGTVGAQPRALAAGTERILLERAILATRRGDYRKAIADFERLVELASLHPAAHVLRLQNLALNLARVGEVEKARTVVLEALRRGKRIFDVDAESTRWCYLGLIEVLAGNWRDAAAAQSRARELAERAGAPSLWYLAMGELARARQVLDGNEASDRAWQEALAGTPAVGPPRGPQLFHLHWARTWILIRRRDWEGARDACAQSRAHLRAPHPINHAENELMAVEIEAGRISAAKRAGEKAGGVNGPSGASFAESLRAAAARLDALEPYLREQRLQNELVELARVRLALALAGLEVAPAETLLAEIATRLLEMGAGARLGDVAREFADTPIALEPRFRSTFAPTLRELPVGRPAREEEIGTIAGRAAALELAAPQFDRAKLRIHALGRLTTIRAGEEEPMTRADWGSRKARLLLAYFLAADPEGRGVSRDALCEAVWPDSESFTIDQTFRVTMNLLRKALRPAGRSISTLSAFLVFKDGLYRLDQAMIWYDTREFDKALSDAAACEHQGQADAARERRRHAFDLYQGEFLSDIDETWIEPLREHYRSRVVEIGTSLATKGLAAGRFDEAQEIAERLVSSDPLSEAGHRLLIRAYLAAGQRDAAVRQLERCRSLLARELGLEVSRETAALLGSKPLPVPGTAPSSAR